MSNKDYKRGMGAASRVFDEKFDKMGKQAEQVYKNFSKRMDEEFKAQDDINDYFESKFSDIEKKEVFDSNTSFDIKDEEVLESIWQEYLVNYLMTLALELGANEYQQKFNRSVIQYLGVDVHTNRISYSLVENIKNLDGQKAFLQTVMEYLFLSEENFSFLDKFDDEIFSYFSVTSRARKEIKEHISRIYQATGAAGIAEKYGFTIETDTEAIVVIEEEKSIPYYDGKDICQKCAEILYNEGIREYIEIDNYLIYFVAGSEYRDTKSQMIRITKSTGEKKTLNINRYFDLSYSNHGGSWDIKIGETIVGWGDSIYFVLPKDNKKCIKLNVETNTSEEFTILQNPVMKIEDNILQANDRFIVYRVEFQQEELKIQLLCYDMINHEIILAKDYEGDNYTFYLLDKYIFIQKRYECLQFDIEKQQMKIIDKMDYDEYEKKEFLSWYTKYYDGIVYSLGEAFHNYKFKEVLTFVDVNDAKSIQTIQLPRKTQYDNTYWMNGYGKVYYITVDGKEELGCFNVLTKEHKILETGIRAIEYSYKEALFSKKRTYEYDKPQESRVRIIGKWLVYKRVERQWEDTFRAIGELVIMDLESYE